MNDDAHKKQIRLRFITQAIFYSLASNMEPTFLPEVTTELLYRLLEWTYWYVSLTEQENSHSMTTVAPLAASILQVLKIGEHEDMKYDDDVLTAYVYVGHDTDVARLSSAFGLRHNLAAPYYTSAQTRDLYSPAPPGSAMHLVRAYGGNGISISHADNVGRPTGLGRTVGHRSNEEADDRG